MAAAPPSFTESHAKDLAANPSDLTFRLTIEGRQFHLGQRIPLRLSLASTSPKKYQALTSNFDRSGRLPSEEFVVESAADARDPSADYFGSGVIGGIAGGPRNSAILETKPVDIEFPLNDWIRFDRAGRYRFYLKTHRLSRERTPADAPEDSSTIHFAATSNIVEVEILPADAGWQAQKLLALRTILDTITGPPELLAPPEDQKLFDTRSDLRYLGTPAAVELAFELARREGRVDTLLLTGARNRPAMLKSFDAYLSDPDVETTEWDIRLRAMFRYLERDKVEPLPFALWQMKGKTWQDFMPEANARQARYGEILREEAARLIPAVTAKKPEARKSLVDAIARLAPDAARRAGLIEPDPLDLPRQELIRRFASFTKEQQERLLDKKWDAVRGPEMIPLLREMLRKVAAKPFGPNAMFASVWGGDKTALLRLAELSPAEAKRLVFARLGAGDAVFGSYAVRMLDAEPLAAADGAFRKAIAAKEFGALPIIARFGSANLLPAMLELHRTIESGTCWDEAAFLGYFTRVAPAADAKRMLTEAMNHREKRGCYRMQFAQLASVGRKDIIEAQALTTLRDDPDPELVMGAAQVLAGGGGPEMEGPLWKRLEQWSAKWRGREVELRGRPIQGGGDDKESRLGEALFQAISSAKSWIIDEARRKRMLGLCIDEDCKQRWGKDHGDGTVRVEVSSGGSLYPTAFRMDSYSYPTMDGLKEKMKQYPKGTAFRWCPQENPSDFMSAGQREDLYRELAASAAGMSLTLEPYDKQLCAFRLSR